MDALHTDVHMPKPVQPAAVNLYVQPEPSPELEERLLNEQLLTGSGSLAAHEVHQACPPDGRENSLQQVPHFADQLLGGAPVAVAANEYEQHSAKVPKASSSPSPRQSLCLNRVQDDPQYHAQPWEFHGTQLHTPHRATADDAPAAAAFLRRSTAGAPDDTPIPTDLFSVHSLSLSGADRDLIDQLLDVETGGVTPTNAAAAASSLPGAASGPFADAALQPSFPGYAQRATPAQEQQVVDMLDVEAHSASAAAEREQQQQQCGQQQQQQQQSPAAAPPSQLLNAYSEPLPFSAALPQHVPAHPPHAHHAGAFAAAPGAYTASTGGAAPRDAGAPRAPLPLHMPSHGHGHGGVDLSFSGASAASASAAAPPHFMHGAVLEEPPTARSPHHCEAMRPHPHGGPAARMFRSVALIHDDGLLPAAHSAPAPGVASRRLPSGGGAPGGFLGGGPLSPPSYVEHDGHMPLGGAAAISAESAPRTGAAGVVGAAVGGAPARSSPSDSRGKRVRHQLPVGDGSAEAGGAGGGGSGGAAGAAGAAGGGSAATRPSSPSGARSVGDPMSVSGMEGTSTAVYSGPAGYPPYGAPYPPPHHHPAYGPPPYAYGMPYADPYYPPHHPAAYAYPPHHPAILEGAPPPLADPYAADGHPRMLHYPGVMAPRHRIYRRFVSGMGSRREAASVPSFDGMGMPGPGYPGPAGPPPGGPPLTRSVSLGAMGSHVAFAASGAPAGDAGPGQPQQQHGGGGSIGGAVRGGGGGAGSGAASGARMEADAMMAAAPTPPTSMLSGSGAAMDADTEMSQVAREAHEAFAADDVPLPLPSSTVDGIRQELRVVTQELLHKRMADPRTQKQSQAAGALGDAASSIASRPDQAFSMSAAQPHQPLQQHSYPHPGYAHPPGARPPGAPPSAAAYIMPGGPAAGMVPKQGSASVLASTTSVSPVRARPASSAPVQHGAAPGHYSTSTFAVSSLPSPAAPVATGTGTTAPPARLDTRASGSGAPGGGHGPSAMRQLFPGAAPLDSSAPHVAMFGPCASAPAAPYGRHGAASSAPPPGPRPAISGKSAASATQSVSAMQVAGAQQMSGAVPMGSYRVGQQGSMAADVEDDGGEEVHGPPQRSSASVRPSASGVSAPAGGGAAMPAHAAVQQPPPPLAGYYPPTMSYEYPPPYYYPPPPYGMRAPYGPNVYAMPPPAYRGGPAGAVPPPPHPSYGMGPPPPQGAVSAAWHMEYAGGAAPSGAAPDGGLPPRPLHRPSGPGTGPA